MPRRRNVYDPFDGANVPGDFDRMADASLSALRRLDPWTRFAVIALLFAGLVFVAVSYYRSQQIHMGTAGAAAPSGSPDLFLGNPSGATDSPGNSDNFLMAKPYYSLSYNNDNGTPNWVSWRVTAQDLGDAPRKPDFDPDSTLPLGYKAVASRDYSSSGFDRGHMCPHGDRSATIESSYATFVMTNLIPQAPHVNRKAWAQEESYLRGLVRGRHQRLYIVAGPAGHGGVGSRGPRDSTANGKVTVPAACWKVAVAVPDEGYDDLSEINSNTRVVTVLVPNNQEIVGDEWAQFRTSPAEIERRTNLHFFDRLPPDVGQSLRQKVDDEPIPPPRPLGHGAD